MGQGEIDIVAKDKDTLVFVEVKCRKTEEFGDPELAVGAKKQRTLSLISMHYLTQKPTLQEDCRFDVVAIKILPSGTEVTLIQNAFELAVN